MQLKNGTISVEVRRGVGYTIRHREYSGATFTVDEDLILRIGLSSRMGFAMEDYRMINEEINAGISYMAKVKMLGKYPFEVQGNNRSASDIVTVKPSNYVDSGVYEDIKGRGILFIGNCKIVKNEYGFDCNREGSPYVCGFFRSIDDIQNVVTSADGRSMYITLRDGVDAGSVDFDSRVGKPAKMIRLKFKGSGREEFFYVNGNFALQVDRRYTMHIARSRRRYRW